MNIVICEDSISDRHKLEKVITKVLIKNNLNSEIYFLQIISRRIKSMQIKIIKLHCIF